MHNLRNLFHNTEPYSDHIIELEMFPPAEDLNASQD